MPAEHVPPYLRIVTEIRRRIAAGELAPGDRIPAIRQVAKEWDVALATAAKALTVLRQEGVVRTQPRVGTVVAPTTQDTPDSPTAWSTSPTDRRPAAHRTSRRRAQPPQPRTHARTRPGPERPPLREGELTRERVVRTAIRIADAEGLAALSMRGVAAHLGAGTMSPYRYVHSKDDLVLLMTDAVFGEIDYRCDAPAHWRPRLESGARALWALHRAHPWLAQIGPLNRPLILPGMIAYSEWMLSALDGHGLGPATMLNLNVLIYSYVQGMAVHLEREAQAEGATGLSEDQWLASQAPSLAAIMTSGDYPTFTRVLGALGEEGYDLHLDELFETGLTSMLDGLSVLIEGTPTSVEGPPAAR
ncbi:TetR/AcrR family transcriptional regulator C-terminal domain-containing protein [Streptomyces sp. MST-110588]|uniref:TetR/AcrR family transcriptional regulator C-terminal domain-containing protein n=1 Tax=Streptomyces sp. MST-110588 TaxID=2833628 RepID=UPI001F5E1E0F|nr:TetR/AcrR family transcriptional regulator C-terminal domain-containing protein [Streptomyces sp. MST-110588]UNO38523.1 TetR/AcrR family transcriptional regulator C-terminal domain-containing protein [Streptomyces sp. MST-110588]